MAEITFPADLRIQAMSSPEYVLPTQFVHRTISGRRITATLDDGAGLYMGRIVFGGFQGPVGGRQPTVENTEDIGLQYQLNAMNNRLNDARNYLALPLLTGDNQTVPVVNTPTAENLQAGQSPSRPPRVTAAAFSSADDEWQITLDGTPTIRVGEYVTARRVSGGVVQIHRLMQCVKVLAANNFVFAPNMSLVGGTNIERATMVHVEKLQLPTLTSAAIQALAAAEIQPGAVFNWIERV